MWPCNIAEKKEFVQATLITLSSILIPALLWLVHRSTANKPRLPPGPRGLPLVGYLPFLGKDLHLEFFKLASIYGPIYKLCLGKRLCIVVSSASLVKQIVRDYDTIFANHDLSICGFIASFGGNDIVVAPYGREWKKLRRVFVQHMLSGSVLDSLYSLRREEIHKCTRHIFNHTNEPVYVGRLSYSSVMDALMSMLWGREVGDVIDRAEFKKAAAELFVLLEKPNVSDLYPTLAWLDIQGIERKMKKLTRTFEAMHGSAIESKRMLIKKKSEDRDKSDGSSSKDFLEFLLEMLESEDSAESISMAQLNGILMDIIVGGVDTTSTTIEWAMAELLNHPEEMKKVQDELAQVVGLDNMVEEFHLPKLTYLKAAIYETFRLHLPFALLVPRSPSESTVVGGYFVPKTAKIFLNVWSIHRDPSIWENPLEYRPERFLSDNATRFDYSGNNFSFIPFGSGRRICAGIPIAERMVNYVLATLLHSFNWKLPSGANHELSDKFGVVVRKREPLILIPSPRLVSIDLYTGVNP